MKLSKHLAAAFLGGAIGLGAFATAESTFRTWGGPQLKGASAWGPDYVQVFEDEVARCYVTPPTTSRASYSIACVRK